VLAVPALLKEPGSVVEAPTLKPEPKVASISHRDLPCFSVSKMQDKRITDMMKRLQIPHSEKVKLFNPATQAEKVGECSAVDHLQRLKDFNEKLSQ
jgi:hypothetical protein